MSQSGSAEIEARLFDLNIKKILESWDNSHAVRELIANALDEQVLSNTDDVQIIQAEDGEWTVRDFGRGLRYENFTQNENPEKIAALGRVIGKFGVGLKDAMATLDRNGIKVEIESRFNVITLAQRPKHGFGDVVTLHAQVSPPRDGEFHGTIIRLVNLTDEDMRRARGYFLKFSAEVELEETRFGQILLRAGQKSRIYVAGLLIAEEDNFVFSYNIISLTEAMKKALNRERTNVGRTAYSERIKAMLLQTKSSVVAQALADQLVKAEHGTASDEVAWKDVAVHACKLLNASGRYLFVTSFQLLTQADAIGNARDDGITIITVPETIHDEVAGSHDTTGSPVRDLDVYQSEWNDSFSFDWVSPNLLTPSERAVFDRRDHILDLVGGLPTKVSSISISRTMRKDFSAGVDALGLWDGETASIVIRRDQLRSLEDFAGVLLHEVAHAKSGYSDVTRDFRERTNETAWSHRRCGTNPVCHAGKCQSEEAFVLE